MSRGTNGERYAPSAAHRRRQVAWLGIDAALSSRPRANVLVVFTDGGTPWHDRRLPVPMIVALIGKHATDTTPEWAKTVRVPPSETAVAA